MLLETLNSTKDLGRVHEIAMILIRFGFGDIVRRLGLASIIDRAGKVLHWSEVEELAHLEPPARVRTALEEMGPTFVKLGQILATRPDLFSPQWIEEFQKLQDQVQPVPFAEILPQLEEDLGGGTNEVFSEFDQEPLAAASIAQVYKARLKDNSQAIVKVRRPGIRSKVEADLRLLKILADIAEKENKDFRRYRPQEIVHQFTLSMRRELDLAGECRNTERMAAIFADDHHTYRYQSESEAGIREQILQARHDPSQNDVQRQYADRSLQPPLGRTLRTFFVPVEYQLVRNLDRAFGKNGVQLLYRVMQQV